MSNRAQARYTTKLVEKKLPDGRTVYQTAKPKPISPDIDDIIITADERDRSDIIANNVFGSAMEWWRIAAANGRVDGSLHFTPGQRIIIPRKR